MLLKFRFAAAVVLLASVLTACNGNEARPGEESPPPADAEAIRSLDVVSLAEVQTMIRQLGSGSVAPEEVTYADVTGDRREEAIVPISSQGTLGNLAYLVLKLKDGAPVTILSRVRDRSNAGGLRITVEDGRLVETAPEYGPQDAFCCPSVLRKTYFRWDGSRLQVEKEVREQQPPGPKS